jgi:hypothetical protein
MEFAVAFVVGSAAVLVVLGLSLGCGFGFPLIELRRRVPSLRNPFFIGYKKLYDALAGQSCGRRDRGQPGTVLVFLVSPLASA